MEKEENKSGGKQKKTIPVKGDPGYWDYMKKVGKATLKSMGKPMGRPRAIKTPEEFWDHACNYFAEVDSRPFVKEDFIRGGDSAGKKVYLETIAPYTWAGFDEYLFKRGIAYSVEKYRLNEGGAYGDFRGVVARVAQVMFDQKFRGAAVGAFNSSIIARDLQLAEVTKSEVKADLKVNEIDYSQLSESALEELAKQSKLYAGDGSAKNKS